MSISHKFYSQYSPIQAGTVNLGSSNVQMDWYRIANEDAAINGVQVEILRKKYNDFVTDDDVKAFFKAVILKDLDKKIDKDAVVDYLMTAFHQGGLLYPVSAAMSTTMHEKAGLQPWATAQERQLRISSTRRGFKIVEIHTTKKMLISDPDKAGNALNEQAARDEMGIINPDEGKDFVIKVGACIDVAFRKDPKNPTIKVQSNFISYGSKAVQAVLDLRSIRQVLVDFFKNVLGLNSVKDSSPAVVEEVTNSLHP